MLLFEPVQELDMDSHMTCSKKDGFYKLRAAFIILHAAAMINHSLTHHTTHKLHLLSTYVGPTSGRDATWRCLRGINLPGRSLQTRLHPHLDLSHPDWMEKIEKNKKTRVSK